MNEIHLYEAIKQMRTVDAKDIPFSFAHATLNLERKSTDGIRVVKKARLRPRGKNDNVANKEFKLYYVDLETGEPRNCWQHLIMFFNDQKVIL